MSGAAAEGRLPACARSSSGHVCRHTSATTGEAMMAETESCANCCPRVDSLQAFLMHLCICFSSPLIGSVHPVTSPGKKNRVSFIYFIPLRQPKFNCLRNLSPKWSQKYVRISRNFWLGFNGFAETLVPVLFRCQRPGASADWHVSVAFRSLTGLSFFPVSRL